MTRSHKHNDRDHKGLAGGTVRDDALPRYFAKSGYSQAPNGFKKKGFGKGNWGGVGAELLDDEDYSFKQVRRRSNSFGGHSSTTPSFKTKFDMNEADPVFEDFFYHVDSVQESAEENTENDDSVDADSHTDPAEHSSEDGHLTTEPGVVAAAKTPLHRLSAAAA